MSAPSANSLSSVCRNVHHSQACQLDDHGKWLQSTSWRFPYRPTTYLLVVQDYYMKWAEAVPLPDQTAARITGELIKVFSIFGHPEILHSDQGHNFESSILAQTLEAFGVHKSRTTPYHPQGDGMVERFNRSLLQLVRAYVDAQSD